MYKERSYRNWVKTEDLVHFEVVEAQTDLLISASKNLERQARALILTYRKEIESYIKKDQHFYTSLEPVKISEDAPDIVKAMAEASRKAGVGPMAAVAGAVAEFVGKDLLASSDEVIVENGGDIFIKTGKLRTIGIYAGEDSPFTGKLALEIEPKESGIGVCTSSGTVSHSLSFGKSDAALIISPDTALADAVATATGNILKNQDDTEKAINFARSVKGVIGVLVIFKNKMGSWGEIKLA